jgi:hypothetical protein
MAKLPIKKPLSKEPMVHLKQTGKLPMKIQPKQKPPMTLQTKEKAKSPSTEETLDMTQQEQSPKIQAKAIAAKEHVSPLPHRQGLTVQVQIQSPKKKPTDLEKRFQEMQQELLALKAEKSMMIDKGLSSAQEAAKKKLKLKKGKSTATSVNNDGDETTVEDTTIDYRITENYSIWRFEGHKIKSNDEGPPIITLMATWKGYPDSGSPTEEK